MVCYEASTRLLNGVSLKALEWSYGKRLERFHFEPFLSQCSAPISLWGFFMVALRTVRKYLKSKIEGHPCGQGQRIGLISWKLKPSIAETICCI
ncbi:uncharacterized protein LOC111241707 isoform X3 [Vigna radiata var. radiata]|uniref:Uncharacterized protein LOC111241707 isoform X3 n=1 Tax=Vigna radiata var. radiata TaxID=3916 RepID=A0A3Q0F3Y4_VIGRR|nr:uncharacterized protein LOC111241707 isoform X3 [Vigna radiata var. radiata]